MDQLYLEILDPPDDGYVQMSLESFIAIFLYDYLERSNNIKVCFVSSLKSSKSTTNCGIKVKINDFKYSLLSEINCPKEVKFCVLPVYVTDVTTVISGLCGVCRGIIKGASFGPDNDTNNEYLDLLGFKGACLMAPSECSVWTKFCEVDIIACVRNILKIDCFDKSDFELPEEIVRFESHMLQPIRIHNIYKLARDIANQRGNGTQSPNENKSIEKALDNLEITENESDRIKVPRINKKRNQKKLSNKVHISSSTPVELLNLEHKFVEGHQITIADIILYSNIYLIFKMLPVTEQLYDKIPLSLQWFDLMNNVHGHRFKKSITALLKLPLRNDTLKNISYSIGPLKNFSLYKSDPKRYQPRKKIYTKQEDIEKSLLKIQTLGISVENNNEISPGKLLNLDWTDIPFEAQPEGGDLPQKRLERKKQQLQSMVNEVIVIARDGDVIVDFCSGAGHLGILIAYKLPRCQIILLENKEESLGRAKNRVLALKLTNVTFLQCNLDYFQGNFSIGVSLHACGVVTDIVLSLCMRSHAKFVCCPCCYGGVKDMHHLTYPLSEKYKKSQISNFEYMCIAHCSDQAHSIETENCNMEKCLQGELCMDVIDTDRKLKAEENGYKVIMTKLEPVNCTQKNRLLVGLL